MRQYSEIKKTEQNSIAKHCKWMWLNLFVVLFFMLELYKIKSNIDFPFDSLRIAHLWNPSFFFTFCLAHFMPIPSMYLCVCVCVIVLFLYNSHFTFDPSEVRALDAIVHTQRNRGTEKESKHDKYPQIDKLSIDDGWTSNEYDEKRKEDNHLFLLLNLA